MARNEEKQYSKLNRILLEKQREEEKLRNPKRPRLTELHTAEDIKSWLPSIKKDLDFNLKQSQVPCFPERKIQEFHKEIARLEKEYKAFVRKLSSIDNKCTDVPWTDRPYTHRKRKHENENRSTDQASHSTDNHDSVSVSNMERLSLPILQSEFETQYAVNDNIRGKSAHSDYVGNEDRKFSSKGKLKSDNEDTTIYANINSTMQNAPLQFKSTAEKLNNLGLDYDSSSSDDNDQKVS